MRVIKRIMKRGMLGIIARDMMPTRIVKERSKISDIIEKTA